MSWSEIPEGGKALLVIGGSVLAGLILNEIFPDVEPPREARKSSSGRKKNQSEISDEVLSAYTMGRDYSKKNISSTQDIEARHHNARQFLVEVPPPRQTSSISRSVISDSNTRKYPDHYYGLSKNQQYKFRQRSSKQQTEPPNNV